MIGLLIAFLILFLLAILPLGFSARYDAAGPVVRLIAGPVRITLFPRKKRDKKAKKAKIPKKPKEKATSSSVKKKPTAKGGSINDFIPLVRILLDLLEECPRKFRVNRLELKMIMAADDPCDLAVNYGRAWAAVGNLFALLERVFVIKKRDVEVECDFTASETLITARLDITITLGRIFNLAGRYGFRALREFLKIMKLRKGGAVQ